MKKILLLSFLFSACRIFSQGICNEAGNIIIFSNYDGGEINIVIDENIPDIQIGICSYESIDIYISGTYAENVTKVSYAGYDSEGTTSVTGVDDDIVDIQLYPPATLDDPDGNVFMVCAYECDTDFVPGGCNTVDQVTDYFLTELTGSLRFSYLHYEVFGTDDYPISEGGNCCFGAADCILAVDGGADQTICESDTITLTASGADNYIWTPLVDCVTPCSIATVSPLTTTTYLITGTDDEGCLGVDSVTVTVLSLPEAIIDNVGNTLFATGVGTYQWLLDGEIIPGATDDVYVATESGSYSVVVTSAEGCDNTSPEIALIVQGINSLSNDFSFQIFPNPAETNSVINIKNSLPGASDLTLFNTLGEKMFASSSSENKFYIQPHTFTCGIYYVQIQHDNVVATQKLVIS
ncbi:MAG: T9SS type A sorting domain-containing protein, partial [Chitinophagales bacterium]|nr:T9SS type A sorting domain-containing protein [Chitinophagales bacterium]